MQSLAGYHSAAFTLDRYADAVPERMEEAVERVAAVLAKAFGSKMVASADQSPTSAAQVVDLSAITAAGRG